MNRLPNSTPGQDAFEQGIAQINRGYHDQGEVLLEKAVRLGHPHAAGAITDMRLARKVVGLAQAGQRNLALAYLEDVPALNYVLHDDEFFPTMRDSAAEYQISLVGVRGQLYIAREEKLFCLIRFCRRYKLLLGLLDRT